MIILFYKKHYFSFHRMQFLPDHGIARLNYGNLKTII